MKYVLDTDILIYFLNGRTEVTQRILELDVADIATTIISHSELHYGAYNSAKKKSNLTKISNLLDQLTILPFTEEDSVIFATQKAKLKSKGLLIPDMDLMIARITMNQKLKLVTTNNTHYKPVKKLHV